MKIVARTVADVTILKEFTGSMDLDLPDIHKYQTLIFEWNEKLFDDIVNTGIGRCTSWKDCILLTVNMKELNWLKSAVSKTSLARLGY